MCQSTIFVYFINVKRLRFGTSKNKKFKKIFSDKMKHDLSKINDLAYINRTMVW